MPAHLWGEASSMERARLRLAESCLPLNYAIRVAGAAIISLFLLLGVYFLRNLTDLGNRSLGLLNDQHIVSEILF